MGGGGAIAPHPWLRYRLDVALYKILTASNEVSAYFINGRKLHIKRTVPIGTVRLVHKLKHRTNVPYPYHYKKRVPYFFAKIEAYRTVLPSLGMSNRIEFVTEFIVSFNNERRQELVKIQFLLCSQALP